MKRIIVCCDGTWNDEESGGEVTNVVRMSRAVLPLDERGTQPIHQVVYYHPGVGTGNRVDKLLGGGIGAGLSHNVQECYAFIADNFVPGDEIFLFGFSRGAYTARSIAGLIGWSGMLRKADMDEFQVLWHGYKAKNLSNPIDVLPRFPDRHEVVRIKCVGVWDTVGALGIPGAGHVFSDAKNLYQFHDTNLGPRVENAFHALALDETRKDFEPTLWAQTAEGKDAGQVLRQVWFAGAHSNVGGGYPEHGLSDVALAWMAAQVEPMLALNTDYVTTRQDRRDEWAMGRLYDSATGPIWSALPRERRRPFTKEPQAATYEALHPSAIGRAAKGAQPRPGPYLLATGLDGAREAALLETEARLRWSEAVAPAEPVQPVEGVLARIREALQKLV